MIEKTISPSKISEKIAKFQQKLFFEAFGPKIIPFRLQLDLFKGLTFLWILFLMNYFQNYSSSMYLYLFLHGTYGIFWVVKDLKFPDGNVLRPASIGSHLILAFLLISYWMIPLPLAAGYGLTQPSLPRIVFLIVLYSTGIFLMMGSDYQKNTQLLKKKGLISDGFFKYTRNPNYLGQTMIYSSFVLCSGHSLGFLIFYGLGGFLFTLNIYVKEELSYKKKEGWEKYSKQSYVFLPKLLSTDLLNFVLYSSVMIAIIYFLASQTSKYFWYPFNKLINQ